MSKYFEYTREENEYYALIKADSKKDADFVYWRDIMLTDEDKENTLIGLVGNYNSTELTEQEALEKYLSADAEATEEEFYKTYLILVDADLI
ncbi:hypothetical protein JRB95_001370 [Listeria monocytogenes]|nr:hypothetical protein [Listeria monocytogenes]